MNLDETTSALPVIEMDSIIVKDLVLVGGGHAHVHTLKMLGMDPIEGVRVTLITRDLETPYSGMLPGYVAGHYAHEECHIDLVKLCGFANIRMIHGEACDINVYEKKVYLKDNRPPVRYDVLSLDIGISPVPMPQIWGTDGATSSITPVKPIDGFAMRWHNILERILSMAKSGNGLGEGEFHLRIVGGGAGGIELAFALHHRLHKELKEIGAEEARLKLKVSILNRGGKVLDSHNPAVQKIIVQKLKDKGIATYLNTEVVESVSTGTSKFLKSASGDTFPYDEVIWCTQGTAQPWLKSVDGLACTEDGFVKVGPTLESISIDDVYACGDVCHLTESPRPKAGVFAVRAGPPLTANLRCRLLGRDEGEQVKWSPQTDFLGIIGTGNEEAVASKGPLGIEGAFVWRLKDRIDRLWMKMYQVLPDKEEMMREMKRKKKAYGAHVEKGSIQQVSPLRYGLIGGGEEVDGDVEDVPEVARSMGQDTIKMLSKAKMRCGGCGSKIGATVLTRVLERAKRHIYTRPEVVAGAGDDAALVNPPGGDSPQVLVHTIDYFRSFIGDPYTFGKIAANHSLSDIHAMNGTPVTALALCVVPYGPEPQVEAQLEQMLAGCLEVLKEEKCTLAGGHTSEGAEPALGLAVNGVADPTKVMRKGPLVADTVIILTKALGTGTVLAADMRGKAKGKWVSEAVDSMVQSNRRAAEILQSFDCRFCTDVTGFGFLGHLIEMIKYKDESSLDSLSSIVSAVIDMGAVPTLEGAEQCVEQGILSTLHPQNIRCSQAIGNIEAGKGSLIYPLLFDPQTAGGLIATVPRGVATDLINALRAEGYGRACVVGEIVTRTDDSDFAPLVHLRR